jgi:hypothetical protein
MRVYAECMEKFGDKPWRTPRTIEALYDEDLPKALAYV